MSQTAGPIPHHPEHRSTGVRCPRGPFAGAFAEARLQRTNRGEPGRELWGEQPFLGPSGLRDGPFLRRRSCDGSRREMGVYDFAMCSRAACAITADYAQYGNPLRALAEIDPKPDTLRVLSQPRAIVASPPSSWNYIAVIQRRGEGSTVRTSEPCPTLWVDLRSWGRALEPVLPSGESPAVATNPGVNDPARSASGHRQRRSAREHSERNADDDAARGRRSVAGLAVLRA